MTYITASMPPADWFILHIYLQPFVCSLNISILELGKLYSASTLESKVRISTNYFGYALAPSRHNQHLHKFQFIKHHHSFNCFCNKFAPVHIMKAYRGSTGIAPLILNIGTKWTRAANFMPWQLYPPPPWKEPSYSLKRRTAVPQS
jgi:hypothetical protein